MMDLITRLENAKGSSNELDMDVEIALFEPDDEYTSVRKNSAGTKLIYTKRHGAKITCLAWDWSMNVPLALAKLRALTPTP